MLNDLRNAAFIKETNYNYQKVTVYVLVNFNTTFEEDLHRVYKIRDTGATPYIMIYEKENAGKKYRHLQRYVNAKPIFRSTKTFNEYNSKSNF